MFCSGWILIDRCGKHFGTILNYLRDGAVPLPETRREIEELLAEAKYYLVQGLADECQASLQVGVMLSSNASKQIIQVKYIEYFKPVADFIFPKIPMVCMSLFKTFYRNYQLMLEA